ncbi:MAG: PQQ-binding-like beta-propeller repeat protein [Actinobacteria bacterium]|nr:PQQ-binding-like beta-propeller repeat protein [Actinomycetota bacterium]MBU2688370.1 PQQ-binding-like beta-propeller repeat protein [Actinomycetota bacterium]
MTVNIEGDKLFCLDSETGDTIWHYQEASYDCRQMAVFRGDVITVNRDNELVALDCTTGDVSYTLPSLDAGYDRTNKERVIDETITGFALGGNIIVLVSEGGTLQAINLETKTRQWTSTLPQSLNYGEPCADRNSLYYPGVALDAYSLHDGHSVWQSCIGGKPLSPMCSIFNNSILAVSGDVLARIDTADGETRWQTTLNGPVQSPPIATGDNVYALTLAAKGKPELYLHKLRLREGDTLWVHVLDEEGSTSGRQLFLNGVLYILGLSGKLHAISAENGSGLATYDTRHTASDSNVLNAGNWIFMGNAHGVYKITAFESTN